MSRRKAPTILSINVLYQEGGWHAEARNTPYTFKCYGAPFGKEIKWRLHSAWANQPFNEHILTIKGLALVLRQGLAQKLGLREDQIVPFDTTRIGFPEEE